MITETIAESYMLFGKPAGGWYAVLEDGAVQKDQNPEAEETAYIFEDGSAIVLDSAGGFRLDSEYGRHPDNEKL